MLTRGDHAGSFTTIVEDEAELLFGCHRGQNDPARRTRAKSKRAGAKVVEVKSSHAIYVSEPRAVRALIGQAASASKAEAAA